MIASTTDLTNHAREVGYAVPAVNVFDEVSMRASLAAAEQTQSPLIVQISVKTVRLSSADAIAAVFRSAASNLEVPAALHLDHCPDRTVISSVIAAGWSSVLFDASDRDLRDALQETREVVAQAHSAGVDVESEIENILGVEDGVGSDSAVHAYSVRQLADAAVETGADLLAPQLGTSHGKYLSRPTLVPERARELSALAQRPVVLHGGTGLTDNEFRSFIEAGVSKINISTAVKMAYMAAAADHLDLARKNDKWDPLALFRSAGSAVTAEVARHIVAFDAAGRAPHFKESTR